MEPTSGGEAASVPSSGEGEVLNVAELAEAGNQPEVDEITEEEAAELDAEQSSEEKPKPKAPVKHKIKIDGEEVELSDEEMKKYASMGKAAQKRMEEAALVRKEHEKLRNDVSVFLEMLQNDPGKVLKDLGIDPEKFSEDYLNKKLEEESKSPEQKEKEKLQKELEEYQKKLKDIEDEKKSSEEKRLTDEAAMKLERDISEAIDSGEMPKHPVMIRKVADLLYLASVQKVDLEAKDVIPIAKKQIIEEFRSLTGVMPEELLEEILGDDKVKSLRRRYLKKLKATPVTPSSVKSTGQDVQRKDDKPKDPINAKDFFSKLGSGF